MKNLILTIAFISVISFLLESDTVWLECTSQSLPFGYIHKTILGHGALAVGENKAFLCTLPEYPPLNNQEINTVDIRLSPEGHAEKVGKPQISNYKKEEFLTENPSMNISFKVKCEEYASKTGTRMFIPINPASEFGALKDFYNKIEGLQTTQLALKKQ